MVNNYPANKYIPEVCFLSGDDWEAVYLNGIKFVEGHRITAEHLLSALGISYLTGTVNEEWLEEHMQLESRLGDNQLDGGLRREVLRNFDSKNTRI